LITRPRDAEKHDVSEILKMIKELADYENLLHEVVANEEVLLRSLFETNPRVKALIAHENNKAIGFTIFFYNFSTFLGKYGIYIEDLYIRQAYRNQGYGKKILEYLCKLAEQENCGRVEWWVLDWNESAINFYKKLGAKPMDKWTVFRLETDEIKKIGNH